MPIPNWTLLCRANATKYSIRNLDEIHNVHAKFFLFTYIAYVEPSTSSNTVYGCCNELSYWKDSRQIDQAQEHGSMITCYTAIFTKRSWLSPSFAGLIIINCGAGRNVDTSVKHRWMEKHYYGYIGIN